MILEPLILAAVVVQTPSAIPTIVQLIIAIFAPSGLATLLTALYMRRKIKSETGHIDADAVQILTNTSVSLLDPMKQQIKFLTEQLVTANAQIKELNYTVKELTNKVEHYELILGPDSMNTGDSDLEH